MEYYKTGSSNAYCGCRATTSKTGYNLGNYREQYTHVSMSKKMYDDFPKIIPAFNVGIYTHKDMVNG